MIPIKTKHSTITSFLIILILLQVFIPLTTADTNPLNTTPYSSGASYKPVIPLKKTTFIQHDDQSYLDDYAFLAAVPTSVFTHENQLFASPLLYYQEEMNYSNTKAETLDATEGIHYFMEDWTAYCGNRLDQITGINVEEIQIKQWPASAYHTVYSTSPYEIANQIALQDWSYSKEAVLAVIEENSLQKPTQFTNSITGTFPPKEINPLPTFELQQTNTLNPIYHEFSVDDNYKYIKAETWWDGVLLAGNMIPTGDPDLQLYCKEEGEWMQAAAVAQWNIYSPAGHEYTYSHVYNPGSWRIGITDFPTEGDAPRKNRLGGLFVVQGSLLQAIGRTVTYHVDVTLYPGIELTIPDTPPFGCRNATLTLTWNNPNVCLGFSLIGPSGEVISSAINESRTEQQEIEIHQLGECLPEENYSITVFTMQDTSGPVDFELQYGWDQAYAKELASSLASATEGAVLASLLNTPLLYVSPKYFSSMTKNTLLTLGVTDIYLMDLDEQLSQQIRSKISNNFNIKEHFIELQPVYDYIHTRTGRNDIIFSTIDPWTSWYKGKLEAGEETKAALFIGPAAYLAAHHGSPVVIVDMHPELSSAVVWHTHFWWSYVAERYQYIPSVADMVLTGRRVYDFLTKNGFNQIGRETIITVAGQYDIGIPWDRVFVGEAKTGRFWGTPTDTAYWISRSMFYPCLIFVNPAAGSDSSVSLINGSVSNRQGLRGLLKKPFLNTLVIKRESREEQFQNPVLCSFVTHKYRFNERGSQYYGSKYQCADGLIPGETTTMNPIDQGVNKRYTGEAGSYFPDLTESEVIPFYLRKGGFDAVFSTQLEAVMNNLNQGVILWIHASHGLQVDCGTTLFWDPVEGFKNHPIIKPFAGARKEQNPWRGYDWELGSTQEPDTMSMDYYGFLPFTNKRSLILPATGFDYVLARKPIREKLNTILDFIRIIPMRFQTENLYDGLTGTLSYSKYPLVKKNASQMEPLMDNLHSAGFVTSICQTSNTYFHLLMIRHGSVFQVQDPWPTSWYGAVWRQTIPRDIILGDTVGEAYVKGMSHVGILYLGDNDGPPQWWWDSAENVVYFGDPDLRMYVPENEYSEKNTWERPEALRFNADLNLGGHMPFEAQKHPHKITPTPLLDQLLWILIILAILFILLVIGFRVTKKQKHRTKKSI